MLEGVQVAPNPSKSTVFDYGIVRLATTCCWRWLGFEPSSKVLTEVVMSVEPLVMLPKESPMNPSNRPMPAGFIEFSCASDVCMLIRMLLPIDLSAALYATTPALMQF